MPNVRHRAARSYIVLSAPGLGQWAACIRTSERKWTHPGDPSVSSTRASWPEPQRRSLGPFWWRTGRRGRRAVRGRAPGARHGALDAGHPFGQSVQVAGHIAA